MNPSTLLASLNLRSPDPVRTAHAAEVLARLLGWLAVENGRRVRTIGVGQLKRGGNWWVQLFEDYALVAESGKLDPIDALAHALTVAEAAESLAATDGDGDTRVAE